MKCLRCGYAYSDLCGSTGCPNCHGEGLTKVTDYLASIGRKGGQAGKGKAKRRSPEHYAELSRKGVEARKRKQRKGEQRGT